MNGNQATNHKFTALLILLLCLFVPDLRLHSKHEGYFKDFIYSHKKDSAIRFSSTDKIIQFQEKDLEARYYKKVRQIDKSLIEVSSIPYLLSRGDRIPLFNLNQKKRLQVKSLKKYFFGDIASHASLAQDLKTHLANIKHHKIQMDVKKSTINETIANFFKPNLSKKQKLSILFNENKGKLLLPTSGSIMKATGEPFSSGSVPWNGILISSQPNEMVRAVGKGKVIFADEFIDFQSVIIIDHGNGYFTIYGNINLMHVFLGQEISTGEIIGQVGGSHQANFDGLYFEIRKAGISLDSEKWFAN